ncbi:uncharacterized protein Z518_07264 [Rhinocladiella mackenziei CBS 650.93]|uniref:Mitochondrial thiamine pyrophosphate carrier 1 n=1 Tax=Rhinocladiella mackenziei CBS 650.93 TaxID=1442369 RepID=A0A0D2IKF0_9EURO|nr:uncharacterized protein Z518_07264 [Rhinocladiella mackenziei CBS 650.93]KIX03711.1 hypothetical protein Z518_07264 [Rhinocladiella mackenziei CBS 650.93]
MADIYNSQLDVFELYHKVNNRPRDSAGNTSALEALGHGIAGTAGAAISNATLYPIDLIITRFQIQRQLRKDQSQPPDEEYKSFVDAVLKIYKNEGGLAAFYTGLLQDTGRTITDSFLFFLTYSFLRNRRLASHGSAKSLPALEELGVGFVAGSLTKLASTPIANIVTRKQVATLLAAKDLNSQGEFRVPSARQIAADILSEHGVSGFWSGYPASLVLTLNPSITFFLFETLKRILLPRHRRANPPPSLIFLLSAFSRACASSATYPFGLAQTRLQAGSKKEESDEAKVIGEDIENEGARKAARATILHTVLTIAQNEGAGGLYEGLYVEMIRAFFSHGTTMLVKQAIQRFLVKAYYITSIILGRYQRRSTAKRLAQKAKSSVEYYSLAMARASEKIEEASHAVKQKANETAEFVGEYVEEEAGEWRELYGTTGLARWLDSDRRE